MSKNNSQEILCQTGNICRRYALRKLSVGVASVLIGTTMYVGLAHADTVPSSNESVPIAQAITPTKAQQSGSGNDSNVVTSSSKPVDQTVPASTSNEIVNEVNQGSVDRNNNKTLTYISNDQQNSFGVNNNVNLNSIVGLKQSAVQSNRDVSNLATNQILSNLKMTLDDADHASSFDWYVGQNDFHTYDINMSFDISANNIVAGRRYSVATVYAPYVYNKRSLPLWISGGYSFPFAIKGTQYGTFYLSNEYLDGPDNNRLAISLSISKSADKKLLGLQHFSLHIPNALQFGYAASPQMFKVGQTQINDPLLVLDSNGDELSRINLKIHLPSATYRLLSPFYWDYDSWGAGSASGVRIVHRALLPFNNDDDLMAAMQGKGPVPRSSYPDIIELGGRLSSSASDINFDNDLVTLNLSLWVYHSDGRLSNELIDLDRHGVSFKSLNLGDSLTIDQMSSRTFNGFGYSRQSDGSYLYLIKIPSSDFVVSDAESKSALLDRSWQIAADSDPQKALQVTLDRFHDGVQLWNVFTITNFLDPSISTVLTNTRLWNNFMSSQNTNQSIYYTTTPIKSGVQGQSTVKLHVVNSENGAELQQVRSFTDWPNQNKHASLTIPSITGYELVSNPQAILSALHLSGTAISSSVQVDYPAENTVADYYVVLQPKMESANVQIVDADESNKVLATGTVSGRFGEQIVSNVDVQSKLDALIKSGHYVLASNGFDSSADYKDGMNMVTISLKHKLDSTQRHYRVIEDLPDGTKKVIIDMEATLYKDANTDKWQPDAAYLDGDFTKKVLMSDIYKLNVGQQADDGLPNFLKAYIDKVSGYVWNLVDGTAGYQDGLFVGFYNSDERNAGEIYMDLFNGSAKSPSVANVASIFPSRDFHIIYTPRSYPVTVNYYDIDGKLVDSVTSTHAFGDTVSISPVAPANYVLVSGQAKIDYLMRAGLNEVDFLVEPKLTITVETKTVTRTIKVQTSDGQTENAVQTVTFVRNGYLNHVTKQTTYSSWSFNGQYQFSDYQPKPMDGYTTDVIPAVVVTPDSLDTTVNVAYHQISTVYSVDYQLANRTVVKNVSMTPERDGTIHLTAPQGYRLLTTVTDVQVGYSSQKLAVLVAPAEQTYTVHDDLPNTVTGSVAWQPWSTGAWDQFDVPALAGYTPSMAKVAGAKVTSETKPVTVDITYTANDQTVDVVYKTPDGTTVKTETINGKTGQTVPVPNNVPENYHTTGKVPSQVTFLPNGTPKIVITVEPNIAEVTDHKTVTRTINVTNPDGSVKTTKQVAHLTRVGNKNEATGETTWGNWSTDSWNQFDVPVIEGYTPTQNVVKAQPVDGNSQDVTVNISYTANDQVVRVVYKTPDGEVVKMDTISGKTGETVKIPNDVPAGYHVISKVPSEVTITGNNSAVVIMVEKDVVPNNRSDNAKPSPMPQAQNVASRTDHTVGITLAVSQNVAVDNGARQPGQSPVAKHGQLPQTGNSEKEKGAIALGLSGVMAGLAGLFGMKKKEN